VMKQPATYRTGAAGGRQRSHAEDPAPARLMRPVCQRSAGSTLSPACSSAAPRVSALTRTATESSIAYFV
jgi:hypothetical protein